jgi:hypothetical protein
VAGQPAAAPASAPAAAAPVPLPGRFNAVFSNANSAHIQLRDFAVEADTDELGILIDGTGDLVVEPGDVFENPNAPQNRNSLSSAQIINSIGAIDITVKDLFLTASTLPAILAKQVRLCASTTIASPCKTSAIPGRPSGLAVRRFTSIETSLASNPPQSFASGYRHR